MKTLILTAAFLLVASVPAHATLKCDAHEIAIGASGADGIVLIDGLPDAVVSSVQWQPNGALSAMNMFSETSFCGETVKAGDCKVTNQSSLRTPSYSISCGNSSDDPSPYAELSGYIVMSSVGNGRFSCSYTSNDGHEFRYILQYSNCQPK